MIIVFAIENASIQFVSTTIVTIIDPPNIVEKNKTNRKTIGDRKTNEPNL